MPSLNRSLFYSFIGNYSSLILQFVSVMVVSRILPPEDIGGYSLALGSIAVGQVLRDFGLSLYLIKEKEISDEKIHNCFTISLILCWSLALLYFLSAPLLSNYFGNESIGVLIQILSINFFIIPFGTFTLSLLKRRMMFDKIMRIDITSSVVSAGSSIALIMAYRSVETLAVASIAGTLTTMIYSLVYAEIKHFRIKFSKIKEITLFSMYVSGANILNELRSIVPEFLIGKYSSIADVAYLSKANGTINLFSKLISGVVAPVLQPYISKIHNNKGEIQTELYQIKHYMLVFQWPFCAFVFVFAHEIILLLYGPQWEAVPPILRICCLLFLIDGLSVLGVQILNAAGDVKYVLHVSIVMTLLRIIFVVTFVHLGLYKLVLTFIVLAIARALLLLYRYRTFFNISSVRLFRVYQTNLQITVMTFMSAATSYYYTQELDNHLLELLLGGIAFSAAWIVSIYIFKHPIYSYIQTIAKKILSKTTL